MRKSLQPGAERAAAWSTDFAERPIPVFEALATSLDEVSLRLVPEGEQMSVIRGADKITFTLTERTRLVKHVPTPEELAAEERRKEKRAKAW